MERVKPLQLETAARVADALVYAAGLAGVIAGGLLFRAGDEGFALVAWVLTFIAGASLRLAAWASRALAELLARTTRMEQDIAALLAADRKAASPRDVRTPDDPYGRWGGHW